MSGHHDGMQTLRTMHWDRRLRMTLIAAALAGSSLLAIGCRPQQRADQPLQLWTLQLAPKFNTYMDGVMTAWTSDHPDAPVRWTDLPWGSVERKLLAAVFARTAPDVVNLNPPFAANLASKGGLTDLTPLLPEGAADRYLPSVWTAARDPQAGQIAVPWYLTVRLNLVNQGLLQQAGLKQPPQRWKDVPAFARAIRETTGRYALFVTVVPDDSAELLESLVQMGVTLLDDRQRAAFATPEGRRAFAFWVDLYRQGLLPREVVSQGQSRAVELYQSGALALLAKGPEFLRSIQTNAPQVAAATRAHPPLTGADGTANVALMTLAVPRQSARPREALALALFLTNGPNQARFVQEAPVLPSSLEALAEVRAQLEAASPEGSQQAQLREARLLSLATLERARVLVPSSPGIKRLQSIIYTQLQRAMLGQISSDQAVEQAALEWNRYAEARWPEH
jgi:putative chitobiose transport system substrate-binding protein